MTSTSGSELSGTGWIAPVNRVNATDQVRADLVEAVRLGRFPVGSKLPSEGELARLFGVSRPVIREALVSLRVLGLTNAQTGRGTFVVSSDVKQPLVLGDVSSEDLNEVRLFLEVPAARLAAERHGQVDLKELEDSVEAFARAEEPAARIREDVRFHLAIANAGGNVLLSQLIGDLRSALTEQSLALAAIKGRRLSSAAEHRRIFEAVKQGDIEKAGDAMRRHLVGIHVAVAEL